MNQNIILQIANRLNGISVFSDLYIKTTNYVTGQNETIFVNIMYMIRTLVLLL